MPDHLFKPQRQDQSRRGLIGAVIGLIWRLRRQAAQRVSTGGVQGFQMIQIALESPSGRA